MSAGAGTAPPEVVRRTALTVAQAEPQQIAGARGQLRELLHDWSDDEQVDSAVLMISEMITNVLVHTDGDALLVAEARVRSAAGAFAWRSPTPATSSPTAAAPANWRPAAGA